MKTRYKYSFLLFVALFFSTIMTSTIYAVTEDQIVDTVDVHLGASEHIYLAPDEEGVINERCVVATFTTDAEADVEIIVESAEIRPASWYGWDREDGNMNFTGPQIEYGSLDPVSWSGCVGKGVHKLLFIESMRYDGGRSGDGMDFYLTVNVKDKKETQKESAENAVDEQNSEDKSSYTEKTEIGKDKEKQDSATDTDEKKVVVESGKTVNLSFESGWRSSADDLKYIVVCFSVSDKSKVTIVAQSKDRECFDAAGENGLEYSLSSCNWNETTLIVDKGDYSIKYIENNLGNLGCGLNIDVTITMEKARSTKKDTLNISTVSFENVSDYIVGNHKHVSYSSSNPDVVKISKRGELSPKTLGTSTVKAKFSDTSEVLTFNIFVNKDWGSLKVGEKVNLKKWKKTKNIWKKGLKWKIKDKKIATIKNGKLEAKKIGDTVISCNYNGVTYNILLSVKEKSKEQKTGNKEVKKTDDSISKEQIALLRAAIIEYITLHYNSNVSFGDMDQLLATDMYEIDFYDAKNGYHWVDAYYTSDGKIQIVEWP